MKKSICDLVKRQLPEADLMQCRKIIERTDYPFCSLERLEYQIKSECIAWRREEREHARD